MTLAFEVALRADATLADVARVRDAIEAATKRRVRVRATTPRRKAGRS